MEPIPSGSSATGDSVSKAFSNMYVGISSKSNRRFSQKFSSLYTVGSTPRGLLHMRHISKRDLKDILVADFRIDLDVLSSAQRIALYRKLRRVLMSYAEYGKTSVLSLWKFVSLELMQFAGCDELLNARHTDRPLSPSGSIMSSISGIGEEMSFVQIDLSDNDEETISNSVSFHMPPPERTTVVKKIATSTPVKKVGTEKDDIITINDINEDIVEVPSVEKNQPMANHPIQAKEPNSPVPNSRRIVPRSTEVDTPINQKIHSDLTNQYNQIVIDANLMLNKTKEFQNIPKSTSNAKVEKSSPIVKSTRSIKESPKTPTNKSNQHQKTNKIDSIEKAKPGIGKPNGSVKMTSDKQEQSISVISAKPNPTTSVGLKSLVVENKKQPALQKPRLLAEKQITPSVEPIQQNISKPTTIKPNSSSETPVGQKSLAVNQSSSLIEKPETPIAKNPKMIAKPVTIKPISTSASVTGNLQPIVDVPVKASPAPAKPNPPSAVVLKRSSLSVDNKKVPDLDAQNLPADKPIAPNQKNIVKPETIKPISSSATPNLQPVLNFPVTAAPVPAKPNPPTTKSNNLFETPMIPKTFIDSRQKKDVRSKAKRVSTPFPISESKRKSKANLDNESIDVELDELKALQVNHFFSVILLQTKFNFFFFANLFYPFFILFYLLFILLSSSSE